MADKVADILRNQIVSTNKTLKAVRPGHLTVEFSEQELKYHITVWQAAFARLEENDA